MEKAMCLIGRDVIEKELNRYIKRREKADELGYANNPKYKNKIIELDFRIKQLKNILLCVDVLPAHLSAGIDDLLKDIAGITAKMFDAEAGFENEKELIGKAFDIAANEKHKNLFNDMCAALDAMGIHNDFDNKIQMHVEMYVDLINYLAHVVIFFIAFREIICKIDNFDN